MDTRDNWKFCVFIIDVSDICRNEYNTFPGNGLIRFDKRTLRDIKKCYSKKMSVEETALHINTH